MTQKTFLFCVISQANLIPGKWLMVKRVTYNCQRHTCMHNTSCTLTDAEKHLPPWAPHPPSEPHTEFCQSAAVTSSVFSGGGESITPDLFVFTDLFRLRHCGRVFKGEHVNCIHLKKKPEWNEAVWRVWSTKCLMLQNVCKCSLIIIVNCYFVGKKKNQRCGQQFGGL